MSLEELLKNCNFNQTQIDRISKSKWLGDISTLTKTDILTRIETITKRLFYSQDEAMEAIASAPSLIGKADSCYLALRSVKNICESHYGKRLLDKYPYRTDKNKSFNDDFSNLLVACFYTCKAPDHFTLQDFGRIILNILKGKDEDLKYNLVSGSAEFYHQHIEKILNVIEQYDEKFLSPDKKYFDTTEKLGSLELLSNKSTPLNPKYITKEEFFNSLWEEVIMPEIPSSYGFALGASKLYLITGGFKKNLVLKLVNPTRIGNITHELKIAEELNRCGISTPNYVGLLRSTCQGVLIMNEIEGINFSELKKNYHDVEVKNIRHLHGDSNKITCQEMGPFSKSYTQYLKNIFGNTTTNDIIDDKKIEAYHALGNTVGLLRESKVQLLDFHPRNIMLSYTNKSPAITFIDFEHSVLTDTPGQTLFDLDEFEMTQAQKEAFNQGYK